MTPGPDGDDRTADLLDTGPRPGRRRSRPGTAAGRRSRLGSTAGRRVRLGSTAGRWLRPGTAAGRRWGRVAAAVLGVAVVVLALRAPAGEDPPRPAPVAELPTVAFPPFNGLPGRTAVPGPVGGTLPATGGPDRAAALRAAQLVLDRSCAEPAAYTLTLGPDPDWRRVSVLVFSLDRSGDPPRIALRLTWTGTAYRWTGRPTQLRAC